MRNQGLKSEPFLPCPSGGILKGLPGGAPPLQNRITHPQSSQKNTMIHCKQTEPQNQQRHITYMRSGGLGGTCARTRSLPELILMHAEASTHTRTHTPPCIPHAAAESNYHQKISDVLSSDSEACARRTERRCVSNRAANTHTHTHTHTHTQGHREPDRGWQPGRPTFSDMSQQPC